MTTPDHSTQPPPTRKQQKGLITAIVAGALVLVAATAAISFALTRPDKPAAPAVPSIENIKRPNVACTPAADRKLSLGDDLSQIQWFGWMDGKQMDMPVGQALAQRIAGHSVRDAWYCPPRADWR